MGNFKVSNLALACWTFMGFAGLMKAQTLEVPSRFLAADVHVSPKYSNQAVRTGLPRGERYEIKNATMVDLIRIAYGFDANKILGGPNWLEWARFDVIAKLPSGTNPDTQKSMLQSLLAERFKLVVHKDTQPVVAYILTAGKNPKLKEADGSGEGGCKPVTASGPPTQGAPRLMIPGPNGNPQAIELGPGGLIEFQCRSVTMAAFAEGLRGMLGSNLGPNQVLDQTGLQGKWNFDVRWTLGIAGPLGESGARVSALAAVDKQLGLKLEEKPVPTPVILVDTVNQKPSENPLGTAEALPPTIAATEFEVATIKPTSPDTRGGTFNMRPGGRLVAEGMPLGFLINRAFNTNNNEQIVGLPPGVNTERFDIQAKAPSDMPTGPSALIDIETLAPLLKALLVDRFKMTYHTEDRQVQAYTLTAGRPKMKKADPSSRIWCKNVPSGAGSPPGTQTLSCQNATMAQFAERLQNFAPGLNWPVLDATGIEGGWDFTLSFSLAAMMNFGPGRGGGDATPGTVATAPDPSGGYTIFEAVEKQLGLKLEKQKRSMPVVVIDHIEQKPTEN